MPHSTPTTFDDWISRESIPFSPNSPDSLHPAIDRLLATFSPSIHLLALGEALHGGEDILRLRNRLFQHLVQSHGYTAIALESSFPRGHAVNDYIHHRGPASYDAIRETGFSHHFGRLDTTRELVDWLRQYNAANANKLHFYGFDSPTEMTGADSPRQLLHLALDFLASIDPAAAHERRQRIDDLLGDDAAWCNPAASFDPAQSVGLTSAATALRTETEDLLADLLLRRPELIPKSDEPRFLEATHHAAQARHLLTYHAALARPTPDRIAHLLGIRDLMMADNLTYIVSREQAHTGGKVLAFAHNSHLKRGPAQWQLGPQLLTWWPAGAHLHHTLGPRYAAIGSAVGQSPDNGIAPPEPDTLEARLLTTPGPARLIPTRQGQHLAPDALATLPSRTGSTRNPTYFPLTPQSLTDFDALALLDSTTYTRGGPQLP